MDHFPPTPLWEPDENGDTVGKQKTGVPAETASVENNIIQVKLASGIPLFLGSGKDLVERCEEYGYPIFYVLGNLRQKITNENITSYTDEPRIFKVTKNAIGKSIADVDAGKLGLPDLVPQAWFTLPEIPYELIQKLDYFFREVDRRHGTEAIVMLTFDPRIEGPAGWGVLVPKQENSAGHCKYDPQSIIDDRDDEVLIVGTAHSHPGMGAFASHTDHGDQLSNDGIHITFGWKDGDRHTDFHIEMQMSGTTFILPVSSAFSDAPEPPEFPEAEAWVDRVKKKYTPSKTTSQSYGAVTGKPSWAKDDRYTRDWDNFKLPPNAPDPATNNIVIRLLDDIEAKCPLCGAGFRSYPEEEKTMYRRRCWDCQAFFVLPDETIDDLIKLRRNRASKEPMPVHDLIEGKAFLPLVLWERYMKDGKVETEQKVIFDVESPGKVSAR